MRRTSIFGSGTGSRAYLTSPGTSPDVAAVTDFDAFVAARAEYLVRVARGLLRDPQHAEDVVQEVLAKAHRNWDRVTSRENPDAYVRRMLVNASVSFWRRAARREFAADDVGAQARAAPDAMAGVDDREMLLVLLRRLPPKQRSVLVLRHYEDFPDEEIAQLMGTSVSTVRSNAHRGLASLRRMLGQPESESESEPEPAVESEPESGVEPETAAQGRAPGSLTTAREQETDR